MSKYSHPFNKRSAGIVIFFVLLSYLGCSPNEVNFTPPSGSNEMAITHYSFGKIVVDGKTYDHDILIFTDKTIRHRNIDMMHFIKLGDIKPLIIDSTTTLIIGIGAESRCEVSQDVIDYTKEKGIKLHMLNTYDAVNLFNSLPKEGVSAFFHINC